MSAPLARLPAPDPPATGADPVPLVVFGACDRHNFGDLLMPRLLAALLPERVIQVAGLVARDLRDLGGDRVQPLHALPPGPCDLLHAGGEVLTTTAWQAAVMLLPPDEAPALLPYLRHHPGQRLAWVARSLGTRARAPYLAGRARLPGVRRIAAHALGGVDLPAQRPALRAEVLQALAGFDGLTVRDGVTLATLQAAGLPARLLPDVAERSADCLGVAVAARAEAGELAGLRRACPAGWLALQLPAVWGDDATLDALARSLDAVMQRTGWAVVGWRAGLAPWHDDDGTLARLARRLPGRPVHRLASLHVLDTVALLAGCRASVGASLHGAIVAAAFGRPGVTLAHEAGVAQVAKVQAWCTTWQPAGVSAPVTVDALPQALQVVCAVPRARRLASARERAWHHRRGFDALRAVLQGAD